MTFSVLIVDDSLTVRGDLQEAFEEAGFVPVTAATLAEARAKLAEAMPSLVILDVVLPDGDGVELLRELRSHPATASLPVMLLSSEAEVGDRTRGYSIGADEYVGKPYDRTFIVKHAKELTHRQAGGSGSTVLVVDGSAAFTEPLKHALEGAGYTIVVASTGEDGLRLAKRLRPDVAIIDRLLPGIDGPTVIRRLRLDPTLRTMPCLLTAATNEGDAELVGLAAGADAFLVKGAPLELIVARIAALVRTAGAADTRRPVSARGRKRLLLVDDSPTFLHQLATQLADDDYDVVFAPSGEEALELIHKDRFDGVVLDVMMPGLSGLATCRKIKAIPDRRDMPVVMLTANDDREAIIDGLNAGADDFVVKTSDLEVLRGRLRAQLRRKDYEDESRRVRDERHREEVETTEARAARELADTRAQLLLDLERKNGELERARAVAEDANRFKSEFLATMSHEIRTPLNAIIGFTDLLLEEERDAGKHEKLEVVKSSGAHLLQVINDILDFSKIEAGRLELDRKRFSLPTLLRQLHEMFALDARGKALTFELTVSPAVPAFVVGDDLRIRQVVVNLLGNALKFTANGGISLGCDYRDGLAMITVRDTGIGIPEEKQKRVFGAFEQADRSTTREFGGTGLGLAITKRLVELHGGGITLTSKLGVGSSFVVKLPLPVASSVVEEPAPVFEDGDTMVQRWLDAQEAPELRALLLEDLTSRIPAELAVLVAAAASGDRPRVHRLCHAICGWSGTLKMMEISSLVGRIDDVARTPETSATTFAPVVAELVALIDRIPARYRTPAAVVPAPRTRAEFRILVVEDNEMNRRLMRNILKNVKVGCATAENGAIALEMMRAHPYDLVFLDMEMPVMDGHETIKAIRADAALRPLHVIALTAHAISGVAERCLEEGCDGFVSKPIDIAAFRAFVNERVRLSGVI